MNETGPERAEKMGEACTCLNWARSGSAAFLWSHHPDCPSHDPARETRGYLEPLIKGIREWAAEEDGVPEHLWDAYCRAVVALGEPWPKKRGDDEEPTTPTPTPTLRQGEEPVTEQQPATVTRLVDQQMGDGGHLPVEITPLTPGVQRLMLERDEARQRFSDLQKLYAAACKLGGDLTTRAGKIAAALGPEVRGGEELYQTAERMVLELAALRSAPQAASGEPMVPASVVLRLFDAEREREGAAKWLRVAQERQQAADAAWRDARHALRVAVDAEKEQAEALPEAA